ncbi:Tripartite ATP-independent transporter, DctQ component [Pseudooceanicola antarcticus]|uniref:TRAP transporter small permease protein n=1 Tax=Pseudooceanicola antarcticus TaxID=1247613 RepID=A0A285JER6_9RHOB|nr:TRAP transporter small permease [Pseudooceanicola antarcticus]PJE31093.1 TRAP transporter small permease [Pseudooceanicola antarcticus]SNY58573.1 Tripartite ATP-independent transporter, DctQ component [Pseudooceanicola antarcticus]
MADESDIINKIEQGDVEIRTGLDQAISTSSKVFAWAIFVAFLITVVEVIARYVFDSPTFWAHETTSFLIAAIFLVGGPVALARDKHIRVRMFYDAAGPKRRRALDIVNSLIALIFFAGLAYAAWVMVGKSWFTPTGALHLEGTGTSWNPPTPALLKLLVLICVVAMFIQTVFHLIDAIRRDTSNATDGGE